MPFETLVLFKLALPPPILVEVIYRLEAARIAVFEERQECFAPPPSIELEEELAELERLISRCRISGEAKPPRAKNIGEAVRGALQVLRACLAGYEVDDVVKASAVRTYLAKCLAAKGLSFGDLVGIARAARSVVETYKKYAYSEGPETGQYFDSLAAEIGERSREAARLKSIYKVLETLEAEGRESLELPARFRLIAEPSEPIKEPHQMLKIGGLDIAIVAGGEETYGGVEVPREYLLDIETSRNLIKNMIENIENSLEKTKKIYDNLLSKYMAFSAFGDLNWRAHSGGATVAFYVRERDLEKVDELIADAIAGRYMPKNLSHIKCLLLFKYIVEPPVSERWPYPIQVFNKIVYMYGPPSPGELSPLPLVAFLFPFFFGWMYGDVGYGLLLLLMALVLMRLGKRDWGLIWLMTSFAVIAFGLYYGDFFGIRLWGNGVEYTYMTGIAAALLFGFYIMLIAFLLKIANLILAGEIDAALGVYAPIAVLYAAIGSLTLRLINMPLDVPGLGLLLGITNYARELLYVGSAWVMAGPIAVGLRYGLSHMRVIGNEMALALIEVFISATANILSFARLEIVHIAHGFFSASAKALLGIPGGIALYIVVQLLIAAFEGFLTTIQSLRLIYYETLSKFYRGAGRLFEPQSL